MTPDSTLVDRAIPISNFTHVANKRNDRIVIHHMAGILNAEGVTNAFKNNRGSSQYAICSDGQIVQFVPESERAWTTGSYTIDSHAITIEVSNDGGAPGWHVSDSNIARLIDLITDICKRNGIQACTFIDGDKQSSVLQMHKWWASTACPGPYLGSKFVYISNEVNTRLERGENMTSLPYGYSMQNVSGISAHVYRSNHINGIVPFLLNSETATTLKKIAEFDSDSIVKEAVINANYFQMKEGQSDAYGTHYGVEQDGRLKQYEQAPKQDGLITYYMLRDGTCNVCNASSYWHSKDEILFACTPYSVRVHHGALTYDRSTSFGDKDDTKNTQSVLAKLDDDWCVASFDKCCPRDTVTFFKAFGNVQELIIMDSGGSAQMRAWKSGSMQTVASGDGRKIPNVIALARMIEPEEAEEPTTPSDPETSTEDSQQSAIDDLKAENRRLSEENAELAEKIKNAKEALN